MYSKKILIIHYRVGKSDGVSLEITNWKEILNKSGIEVKTLAGPINVGADFVIPDLEYQLKKDIFKLNEDAFGGLKYHKNEEVFTKHFVTKVKTLEKELEKIIQFTLPAHILVSNMLSVGENLPAAVALINTLDKFRIPTSLVHHDFYWENERYDKSSIAFIGQIIRTHLLPKRKYIKHFTINTIAKKELYKRRKIKAQVLYDCIDFEANLWKKTQNVDHYLSSIGISENDIVLLQATRIIRRKNIEIAIDFARELEKEIRKLGTIKLYKGKEFNASKNKIFLLLAGYPEKRDMWYLKKLITYATQENINYRYLGNMVSSMSAKNEGVSLLSLEDVYPYADIISYPSVYEGFGNQLLEAVFAKKVVAVFEYPVFKIDIKKKGLKYVNLGDKIVNSENELVKIPASTLKKAASDAIDIITDKEKYSSIVNYNFNIGAKHFSYKNAKKIFSDIIKTDKSI